MGYMGMILGYNPAGHSFVLTDLVPNRSFKKVVMPSAGKSFGRICLKAIGETLFSSLGSVIRGGWGS